MKKKILIFATLIALSLSACGGAGTPTATPEASADSTQSSEVIAEARLEPLRATNLTFQARGVVEEVLVKIGDSVNKGDALARLSNRGAAEAQLVAAQNAYDSLLRNESGGRAQLWEAYMNAQIARADAEKKWESVDEDQIKDSIEDINADIEDLKEDLKDAQETFDKYKDLDENNAKRKDAKKGLDDAQDKLNARVRDLETETRKRDEIKAAYNAALAAEAEAKHQYEISLDGPNADQLALAKANLEAAQDALTAFVITAPFSGKIADVNVKAGEQVDPTTRVVSVVDDSQWFIKTTDVSELEVVRLKVGQTVIIRPDALPTLELSGVVTEISDAYFLQSGDILYTVRARVDGADPRLKWGMTVEAVFKADE
ncbi:MAG: HlyD family secretion protein [Anaerolineales bacterium]|nr:HlyD family secretion protein [Anaerolineales bacterium]